MLAGKCDAQKITDFDTLQESANRSSGTQRTPCSFKVASGHCESYLNVDMMPSLHVVGIARKGN
jgi:hypothetical protein